jgi:shikimate kinase
LTFKGLISVLCIDLDSDKNQMTRIYLIGMPGSGKTTIGRQLSKEMGLPFIDLDYEIERREAMSVTSIFSGRGESYFRRVEAEVLQSFASWQVGFVMATGGGAPCFHHGIQVINQTGISVFLDVPAGELARRVVAENHRPLLGDTDREDREEVIRTLLDKRYAYYSQANLRVDAAGPASEIIAVIREGLKSYSKG